MRKRLHGSFSAAIVAALSGCSADSSEPPDSTERTGQTVQAIANEQLGGVASAIYRHYDDAEIAKASYASPALFLPNGHLSNCTGAMIGPSLMLSAGHCGYGPWTASFMLYPHANSTDRNYENFSCDYLVSTWHSSDLVLYYCAPNVAGENPGDKYGYFDLDTRAPVVGDHVYSVWGNQLMNPAPAQSDVRFLSQGTVTSTTGGGTFTTDPAHVALVGGVPDYLTSNQRPIAVETNQWCNGGASGSATINAANGRYAIGPLSIGAEDGPFRSALSMRQYLLDGTVDGRNPFQINSALFTTLGLNAAPYTGVQRKLDANGDNLVDLQVELERMRGERARGWYSLSFGSARQNALWDAGTYTNVTFDADAGLALLHHTDVGYTDIGIEHSRLNVAPGTYRLASHAHAASVNGSTAASTSSNMWIGFTWPGGQSGGWVATNPVAGYAQNAMTATIPVGVTGARLVVLLRDAIDVNLAAISVIRAGEVMSFDSHDKRASWRNDITGARGLVVPYVPTTAPITGTSPGTPNWVARVVADPSAPSGFPLRNRQLGMHAGRTYRICFSTVIPESSAPGQLGRIRVAEPGGAPVDQFFYPSASGWGPYCTSTFQTIASDVNLQFGISTSGSYLIDNLEIQEL